MFGVKSENAEEFEKANIEIKKVRVEKNNRTKESMSFPAIKIKKFVNENFENSEIYNFFSEKKFLKKMRQMNINLNEISFVICK